jgi:hypothetical protein
MLSFEPMIGCVDVGAEAVTFCWGQIFVFFPRVIAPRERWPSQKR